MSSSVLAALYAGMTMTTRSLRGRSPGSGWCSCTPISVRPAPARDARPGSRVDASLADVVLDDLLRAAARHPLRQGRRRQERGGHGARPRRARPRQARAADRGRHPACAEAARYLGAGARGPRRPSSCPASPRATSTPRTSWTSTCARPSRVDLLAAQDPREPRLPPVLRRRARPARADGAGQDHDRSRRSGRAGAAAPALRPRDRGRARHRPRPLVPEGAARRLAARCPSGRSAHNARRILALLRDAERTALVLVADPRGDGGRRGASSSTAWRADELGIEPQRARPERLPRAALHRGAGGGDPAPGRGGRRRAAGPAASACRTRWPRRGATSAGASSRSFYTRRLKQARGRCRSCRLPYLFDDRSASTRLRWSAGRAARGGVSARRALPDARCRRRSPSGGSSSSAAPAASARPRPRPPSACRPRCAGGASSSARSTPSRRLATSLGLSRCRDKPRALDLRRRRARRVRGRDVGHDPRHQAHLRRAGRAPHAGRRRAPAHPREPLLPPGLVRARGQPRVHGDGEAARPRPRTSASTSSSSTRRPRATPSTSWRRPTG